MSVADTQTAVREILTLFKDAWDTTGHIALYEDVPATTAQDAAIQSGSVPWARASIRHGDSRQRTLASYTGKVRYDSLGILTVEVYTPLGTGLTLARSLSTLVRDAYRKATTPGGIWFLNPRIAEIGPEGHWYHTNVIVEFEYDENV